jgi:hypothetical protein
LLLHLANKNKHFMTVYIGSQAKDMFLWEKYPIDSIGVFQTKEGYAYWFWDGYTFDSGVEETEEIALNKAKCNFRSN